MTHDEAASVCKALSDSNRIRIIEMLTQGERCACNLLEELHITQPTLSHHMKVLDDCGLVHSRKDGKWSYYSINCEKFAAFKDYISVISCCDSVKKGCCCKNLQEELNEH